MKRLFFIFCSIICCLSANDQHQDQTTVDVKTLFIVSDQHGDQILTLHLNSSNNDRFNILNKTMAVFLDNKNYECIVEKTLTFNKVIFQSKYKFDFVTHKGFYHIYSIVDGRLIRIGVEKNKEIFLKTISKELLHSKQVIEKPAEEKNIIKDGIIKIVEIAENKEIIYISSDGVWIKVPTLQKALEILDKQRKKSHGEENKN